MGLIIPLIEAAIALTLFGIIAFWLDRSPIRGMALVILLFVTEAVFVTLPSLEIGLNIYPQDLVFLLLASVGLTRFIILSKIHRFWEIPKPPAEVLLLFGMMTIFTYSFIRGASVFGIKTAGVDARNYFYYFSSITYFMTFTYEQRHQKKLVQLWIAVASALVVLAIFRWTATALQLPITAQWEDLVGDKPMRVLNARQAFFISQTFLVVLYLKLADRNDGWQKNLVYVFLPVVFLLQHRSVWVACLAGAVYLLVREGKVTVRNAFRWVVVSCILSLFFFYQSTTTSGTIAESLKSSVTEVMQENSTLAWRIIGWNLLLDDFKNRPLSEKMLGIPFGASMEREIGGIEVDVSPHNYYVETLLRMGILGVSALIIFYMMVLKQMNSDRSLKDFRGFITPRLLTVLLIAQYIYYLPYAPHYEQGIIIGVILCFIRTFRENEQAGILP